MKRALDAFRGEETPEATGSVALARARVAAYLWDDESWDVLSARYVQLARDAGALTVLPLALTRAGCTVRGGVRRGGVAGRRGGGGQRGDGCRIVPYAACSRWPPQGREAEAFQLIEAATRELTRRGEGQGLTFIHW